MLNNFNEAFLSLRQGSEASPGFMLVKALSAEHAALDAILIFDEIADYPVDVISDPQSRSQVVTELLTRAVSAKADEIRAAQNKK